MRLSRFDIDENRKRSRIIQTIFLKNKKILDRYKTREERLISELSKPKLDSSTKNNIFFTQERDVPSICTLLLSYKGFRRFFLYHGIDTPALEDLAQVLSHVAVPRGGYIYKQFQDSNCFYGIISGKVQITELRQSSVLKPSKLLKVDYITKLKKHMAVKIAGILTTRDKKIKNFKEEAKKEYSDGEFFAEEFAQNPIRTNNALALADCDLIVIDSQSYHKHIHVRLFT